MDFENLLNFERASSATYYDSEGVLQTAAVNEPRLDHDPVTFEPLGLLVEEERTNILLNSDTPADQSVTLVTGQYVLSIWGTGSASVGAYGSATDGAPLVFAATAGSESVVITGDLERFQLEQGGFPTSYIPTTGSTATRSPDICSAKSVHPWLDENEGTAYIELDKKVGSYVGNYLTFSDGTSDNQIAIKDRSVFYKETNYMPSPFDPEGYDYDAGDFTINNVLVENPSGADFAGLVEVITSSSFAFINRVTNISVLQDEKVYHAIICKDLTNIGAQPNALRFSYSDSSGFILSFSVDVATGAVLNVIGSLGFNITFTALNNGFNLIQTEFVIQDSDAGFFSSISYCDGDKQLDTPPVGSQIYVQAAFFGKADDWPAIISDTNIIESGANNLTGTQGFTSPLESGQSKLALSYDGSTYSAAKDGVGFSGTNAGVPTLTDLYVGSNGTSRFFNGHIKDVQYYPRKLTESELIELTT